MGRGSGFIHEGRGGTRRGGMGRVALWRVGGNRGEGMGIHKGRPYKFGLAS